jgi:hypothetical protein
MPISNTDGTDLEVPQRLNLDYVAAVQAGIAQRSNWDTG